MVKWISLFREETAKVGYGTIWVMFDPRKRWNAIEALQCSYFQSVSKGFASNNKPFENLVLKILDYAVVHISV
ncbi:unnamed protein product [Gongylonema pulchrum]|uniref:Ovule protein n=1 Tax=Gongylonema pulchrum TaxID=637853 RepID=A0A183ESI1_9BILA|nr:unnamed protein product [Gongylonema pulchrum]